MTALTQTGFSQEIQHENSAILLIEFQNTWTKKGVFYQLIKNEYTQRRVLENTIALTECARKNGVQIIQAPLVLDKNSENYKRTPLPARILKRFTKGTWKAEFTDGIYDSKDLVTEGRYGYDVTQGSNLEKILIQENIKTIFVCGFTTDHCVKATMISLNRKGFKCVMVSNCTATRKKSLQDNTEKEFSIISSGELIMKIQK